MYAEFEVLSPLVSTRETHFLRYCQQNAEEGTWAIVDFPVDSFHQNLHPSYPRYCRRSSGCVIQDMPNGYSRVSPSPIAASNYFIAAFSGVYACLISSLCFDYVHLYM